MRLWLICVLLSLVTIVHSLKFNLGNLFGDQHNYSEDADNILIGSPLPKPFRSAAAVQHLESTQCKKYICVETLECVDKPIQCSCPGIYSQKCYTKDWYFCLRGDQNCNDWKRYSL